MFEGLRRPPSTTLREPMTGVTILVIDAGEDIDLKMTATLEAENYLVYPVSSQDVNPELAELLRPSLIYIKPLELSPTGLKPCKAIHGILLLKKVPIIILASPKKAPGPDDSRDYGIVDFLELTFSPEDLIEKTGTILGKAAPSLGPKEDEPVASPKTMPKTKRKMEKKRSALLLPAIGIVLLLMIAGAGFLAYQQFMPIRKVLPSPTAAPPSRSPSTAPRVEPKSQLPPERNLANTSAPVPSVPSTPPGQPSLLPSESPSQPPRKPFYSVQLGAFKDEDRAEALAKKFREKGYDAFIHPGITKDRSPIYRVLVSKVDERKAARKLAEQIQSREEIKTTLYGE
jgi:cell division septation protein DedD